MCNGKNALKLESIPRNLELHNHEVLAPREKPVPVPQTVNKTNQIKKVQESTKQWPKRQKVQPAQGVRERFFYSPEAAS